MGHFSWYLHQATATGGVELWVPQTLICELFSPFGFFNLAEVRRIIAIVC